MVTTGDKEGEGKVAFMEVEEKVPEATISRRLQIRNDKGEHSLDMVVVIEDFRAGFYISLLVIIILGVILTKAFAEEGFEDMIVQVFGVSNLCVFFDSPPSTYVLPQLWCFAMFSGVIYSVAAIFRIQISYLEMKLSRCESVSLIIVYVYVILSLIYLSVIFAVQPNPEKPETMILHTVPYMNLKWMLGMLQFAIVYFGMKVAWVGFLPRWFSIASIIHVIALIAVNIFAMLIIINALGNMGENLEGEGLWWSVRSEGAILASDVFANYLGLILGFILPLIQALYISWKGVKSHAIIVSVSDNRVSAYTETWL